MLKIEVNTKDKTERLDYKSIPVGAVFTYGESVDKLPNSGILYLKCEDGNSVMLNANCGQIEEEDDFILDEKFWIVVNATLVINN